MPCLPGEWRNWQTRRLQVPVGASPWGFKSPLAHDVIPTFPERRRRRRTPLVLLIVATVAVVFFLAGRARSDTRASVAYLDAARIVTTDHADLARQFRSDVLGRLTILDRDELELLTGRFVEEARAGRDQLDGLEVTPTVAKSAAELSLALDSWEAGLEAFAPAAFDVVDHPADVAPIDRLNGVMTDLLVGDRAYARFLEDVSGVDLGVEFTFPEVSYLPDSLGALRRIDGLLAALDAAQNLHLVRDLEVTAVRLEPPESAVEESGQLVLPATDTLQVSVVVANQGNQREEGVRVSVTLQSSTGSLLYQDTIDGDALDAGASTTLTFDAVPVESGAQYLMLIAVAALPGESSLDNNVRQIPFRVNEASTPVGSTP